MPVGFWRHSVSVAAGASIAARMSSVTAGDAMCAGLLHDLGTALIYRFDREGYGDRDCNEGGDPETLSAEEAEAYGGDHAMIGAFALDAWKLPASDHRRPAHAPHRPARRRGQARTGRHRGRGAGAGRLRRPARSRTNPPSTPKPPSWRWACGASRSRISSPAPRRRPRRSTASWPASTRSASRSRTHSGSDVRRAEWVRGNAHRLQALREPHLRAR